MSARLCAAALTLAWAVAALPEGVHAAPQRHAVLIVVDGLRPDAIAAAPAPNIAALAATGRVTLEARAVGIPETLPGFVAMVTGLPPGRHKVTYNNDRGRPLTLPSVFTRVQEARGRSGLYYGKSKLAMLAAPGTAEVRRGPGPENAGWGVGAGILLAEAFASDFAAKPFHFALVHVREPDYFGHDAGWMTPAYLAAVRDADIAVGIVLSAIAASPVAKRTTVLLTSDHGGRGTSHHAGDGEDTWQIPFICNGPGVRAGAIDGTPTLMDVGPTVLAVLGLSLPNVEGEAVKECLAEKKKSRA